MLNLLNSEIFRLSKRPVTWIMLGIVALITIAFYGLIYVFSGDPASEESLRSDRLLELSSGLSVASGIAGVIVIVMAAQLVGSEYGWNTMRALVSRSTSRTPLIMAKAITLILYVLLTSIVSTLVSLGMSSLISVIVDNGSSVSGGVIEDILLATARNALTTGVYAILAFLITVLSRSTAAGIAGGLAISFLESQIWNLLGIASDAFDTVQEFFIDYSVQGLIAWGADETFGVGRDDFNITRGVITLLAWTIGLIVASVLIFRRRDITSS